MRENATAKELNIIGIIEIICGVILFLISIGKSVTIGAIWLVTGLIFGIMFIGFGEIINLLQQNIDKQNEILSKMNSKPVVTKEATKEATKAVLQDIESNLIGM